MSVPPHRTCECLLCDVKQGELMCHNGIVEVTVHFTFSKGQIRKKISHGTSLVRHFAGIRTSNAEEIYKEQQWWW